LLSLISLCTPQCTHEWTWPWGTIFDRVDVVPDICWIDLFEARWLSPGDIAGGVPASDKTGLGIFALTIFVPEPVNCVSMPAESISETLSQPEE